MFSITHFITIDIIMQITALAPDMIDFIRKL